MKKLLMVMTIASLFAACKSGSNSDLKTNKVMLTDTTGVYQNSASSDTGTALQRGEKPSAVSKSQTQGSSTTSTKTPNGNTTSTSNATTTTTTTEKKGWSNRAKGAVIGGAAGAVGGAIISKHKGTGAVVGGLAGAAGGYIIGNEIDKKKGR
ncbi:MAG: glycine zipper domain-containing protein [Ginsengibacter sp.]